jgi:hypothetical protein
MRIKKPILRIVIVAVIGLSAGALLEYITWGAWFPLFPILGVLIAISIAITVELFKHNRSVSHSILQGKGLDLERLPLSTAEFVKLIVKKMRYRRKVRADVMAELTAHFEDGLKKCKTEQEKEQTAKKLISEFGDVKLLGVLLRRAKKRCRPLWRTVVARTFQTIGVLILCFIAYCVYISLGEPTISINYVEEATRLAMPVVDESLNAAPLYQKAIDAYKEPPRIQVERDLPPHSSRRSKFKPRKQPEKIVETVDLLTVIGGSVGDLNEEELSLLQQWISSNVEAIEFFRQASDKPHCWWHRQAEDNIVIVTPMPELTSIRKLVQMIAWHAKLKTYDGNIEEAFADLLACYRAGMHLKGPRSLIEQIVAIAIQALSVKNALDILNNHQIDAQLLKSFQEQLQNLAGRDSFVLNYKVERFFGSDFIQRCYTDNGRGSGHMIPGRIKGYLEMMDGDDTGKEFWEYTRGLAASLIGAGRERMSVQFDRLYNTVQGWAHKTPWQLRDQKVDLEMGMDKWSRFKKLRYWPVRAFAPAVAKANELAHRAKAQIEALITTTALLRYKQDHADYPENLDQLLEADLLSKLPMDPYSDKPLIYKKTDDNFLLYSIGKNFKDEGGEVFRDDKGRARKWPDDEGDAVFWPVPKPENQSASK